MTRERAGRRFMTATVMEIEAGSGRRASVPPRGLPIRRCGDIAGRTLRELLRLQPWLSAVPAAGAAVTMGRDGLEAIR